jgi:hypothetical protein
MEMESSFLARVLVPYRSFEIVSTLPREVAVARINGIVEPHSSLIATFVRTNKLFAGEVSSDRFKVRRIISYRNAMLPVIEGLFEAAPSGSRLRIMMRPAHWITGFFALSLGGMTILFLLSVLGLRSSTHGVVGLSWTLPLAIVYGFGAIGFNLEANRARPLLEEALRATPSGQVQQVLTNAVKPRLSRFLRVRLIGGAVGAGIVAFMVVVAQFLPPSELRVAQKFIRDNRTIRAELGSISAIERASGDGFHKSQTDQPSGEIFEVNVTGTLQSGVVLLGMVRQDHVWTIKTAQLREADGHTMLLATLAAD